LRDTFATDKLQLEFYGEEKCYFDGYDKSYREGFGENTGKKIIFQKPILLEVFQQRKLQAGTRKFPFKIDLPGWLPSSFVYCGPKRSMMRVRYSIRAGMEDITSTF
jgi:hypothetical protein